MTSNVVRVPAIRVVVGIAFALWVLATAVPDCHVFPHAATTHAHIEASAPTVASAATAAIRTDLHQHAAEPDMHLPADALLAALPRLTALSALLMIAAALVPAMPMAAGFGGGLRAPPVALLPFCAGREKLTRFGIDRN